MTSSCTGLLLPADSKRVKVPDLIRDGGDDGAGVVEIFNNRACDMATMNFSVPDAVKEAFSAAFAGENKSAVVAELMRRAIDERARKQKNAKLIEHMRRLQELPPPRR